MWKSHRAEIPTFPHPLFVHFNTTYKNAEDAETIHLGSAFSATSAVTSYWTAKRFPIVRSVRLRRTA